jgi:hypothetical protein
MGWTCSSVGETRNAYRISIGKPLGKWLLVRLGRKWQVNIEMAVKVGGGWNWFMMMPNFDFWYEQC